jgi:hypothetical protein
LPCGKWGERGRATQHVGIPMSCVDQRFSCYQLRLSKCHTWRETRNYWKYWIYKVGWVETVLKLVESCDRGKLCSTTPFSQTTTPNLLTFLNVFLSTNTFLFELFPIFEGKAVVMQLFSGWIMCYTKILHCPRGWQQRFEKLDLNLKTMGVCLVKRRRTCRSLFHLIKLVLIKKASGHLDYFFFLRRNWSCPVMAMSRIGSSFVSKVFSLYTNLVTSAQRTKIIN